ncbi:FG-GAP repeat protein [Vibrio paucivorans]
MFERRTTNIALIFCFGSLLFGCNHERYPATSSSAPPSEVVPPAGSQLQAFNIIDMYSANTSGLNANIGLLTVDWESSAKENIIDVEYTVCKEDHNLADNCLPLASTTDATSVTFAVPSFLDLVEHSLFVIASKQSEIKLSPSEPVPASEVTNMIGYIKASNTGENDKFGTYVSLSADGKTLAVGAIHEGSSATGIDGDQTDNSASNSGAVYLFRRNGNVWAQQAYIKASNTDEGDQFGSSLALSADGNTLAVAAIYEDSSATGINDDQINNSSEKSGAVYVFRFEKENWSQQAYIKASNTDEGDEFGYSLSLSADGNTLAAGTQYEESSATGINGDQTNNSAYASGAVYLFRYDQERWFQQAYVKASNTDAHDNYGISVSLNANGDTLSVGAIDEDSGSAGINSDQSNNEINNAGAVYVYRYEQENWSQQAYIKTKNPEDHLRFGSSTHLSEDGNTLAAGSIGGLVYLFRYEQGSWLQKASMKSSNTEYDDRFGREVRISADGTTLAIGAYTDSSSATGINGEQHDNSMINSGATYIFKYDQDDWSQKAYIKASNTDSGHQFGYSFSLGSNGNTLAVSSPHEMSSATGINGSQSDIDAVGAGAVYLFKL